MLLAVNSNDARPYSQLAVMCSENNFDIIFIDKDNDLTGNPPDYIIIDFDYDIDDRIAKCRRYRKNHDMIFGVVSISTESIIINAKNAGCLITLTRANFSANFIDIFKRTD